MRRITLCLLALLAVGVFDHLYATQSNADTTVRRLGLHQDKSQAYWLYFFIAHIYDGVLNPWHWTEGMRTQALVHADLQKHHVAIDVGAGTGFTSTGVIQQVGKLTMLDQSHAQLSKAAKKPVLQQALKLVGDAENLSEGRHYGDESVTEMIGKYDRYTSAGSIEYWPRPEQGVREAFRVLKAGGKATIIGPVHPEWWLSKLFADVWYLFPTETEYIAWFTDAGFENITINQITPEWYTHSDRQHGLIMGFVVTGTRPANATDPPAAAPHAAHQEPGPLHVLMWLPRFVLGNLGGLYYAILPMFIFLKNGYCGGSALATWASLLLALLPAVHFTVMPMSFSPYGDEKKLYEGISDFYNRSSGIWEQVWGEHMHSGFYGEDGEDVDKDPQQAQHDMMEELLSFSRVDRSRVRSIIDIGCVSAPPVQDSRCQCRCGLQISQGLPLCVLICVDLGDRWELSLPGEAVPEGQRHWCDAQPSTTSTSDGTKS
jgi:MPBQ/MSBQ methyltransferase